MSRIHEALKRAETERAAQNGDKPPVVEQPISTRSAARRFRRERSCRQLRQRAPSNLKT